MEDSINFVPLLLVLFLAFAVPLLLGRLRWLPTIVGEIFAGVLIGVSGFNLVGHNLTLEVFSNIGLAFLMFLAGMEINLNQLFSREGDRSGTNLLLLSLLSYLGTLLLAVPGSLLINRLGLQANPWLLAFIFSATSLGVLLPLLKKRELFGTIPGQLMFYTALLADFVTVILLTIFLITRDTGLSPQLFSVLLLFLAFFLVYRLGGRFFRIRAISALVDELSHVTVQIKVRGAIAILMAFVVLAGVLGVELILGAFLAGMIISLLRSPEDTDLVHKLEAFGYGFFIPVFFILVGANLDLPALFRQPASLLFVPAMLLVSLLVKLAPALLFRRVLGWRETLSAGLLLNTHLSLEIAVAVIGLRLGLLSPSANIAIILFAVLTVLVMPVLFNMSMPMPPQKVQQIMLVYGAEDLGLQVARVLEQHGENVRIFEPEPSLVAKARQAGFQAIQADSLRACLDQISQEEIQSLLVLTSSDARNLLACRAAIAHGIDHIVALVNDPLRLPDYRHLDVTTYTPTIYRPALFALMARNPDLLTLLTSTTDEQDVREVTLENPLLSGGLLRTLGLPGNLLVLSVNRDGEIIVPHGNTRLESGDRLTMVGDLEDLQDAAAWLGTKR